MILSRRELQNLIFRLKTFLEQSVHLLAKGLNDDYKILLLVILL